MSQRTGQRSKRRKASVQTFLRLREAAHDMLCLYDPTSPSRREYRAVLDVTPINFSLKTPAEQEALLEGFHQFVKSLSYALQILVRNQRLDLTPYIQAILQEEDGNRQRPLSWKNLAESLATLIRKITAERTLIERHTYVIVPAGVSKRIRTRSFSLKGRRKRKVAAAMEQARQDLSLRTETISQQLASCGLTSRRLETEELADLYYSVLSPGRAAAHPLTAAYLSTIGRGLRTLPPRENRDQPPAIERASDATDMDEEQQLPVPDLPHLIDLLAPDSMAIHPDFLCIGDEYACGIAVTAMPRDLPLNGFLAPLLLQDIEMDISFHIHPRSSSQMMGQLKRNRASHAAARQFNDRHGREEDPEAKVAREDIDWMLDSLARNSESVKDLGLYILVRAPDLYALHERTERVYAVLTMLSLDVGAHPTRFEQAEVFRSVLPDARDDLLRTSTVDAMTIAAFFPFLSNSLYMPNGIPIGITETHEPVTINPWHILLENPHIFVGGVTGSGKSLLVKGLVERGLLLHWPRGDQKLVIDPDQEYIKLAEEMGGTIIRLSPGSPHHLNPFDLLPPGYNMARYLRESLKQDRLAEKILDLHALLDILLADYGAATLTGSGVLRKREKGLLDHALYEVYRRMGITDDPRTHDRKPPLLRDLYDVLKSGVCGPDETDLADRLYRYVYGSLSSLFSEYTNVDLSNPLVVWNISDMRSELRALAIYLIADCVWTLVSHQSHVRRTLVIDEAASLIDYAEGAHFLANLSRRARKHALSLVTITQNPESFVQNIWGAVIAANAAIKILKKQDATSAVAVAERFQLTQGEQIRLINFGTHEALLLVGEKRATISVEVSPYEYDLFTTNPIDQMIQERVSGERAP